MVGLENSKECNSKNHERCSGLVELPTMLANCECDCGHPLLRFPAKFVKHLLNCKGEFAIIDGALRSEDMLCPLMHLVKKHKLNDPLFELEHRATQLNNMVNIVEKGLGLTPAQSGALIRASDQNGGAGPNYLLRKALVRALVIPKKKR